MVKCPQLFVCSVVFHVIVVVCRLSKLTFQNTLPGTLSECQTVWIHIRMDDLSVLIWIQTVCIGYQKITKVAASKEGVK